MKKKSFQQTENNERNPYSKKRAKILHILERTKFLSLNWVRFLIVPKERIIVRLTFITIRASYRQSHKSIGTHIVTQVRLRFLVASWSLTCWLGLGWLYASQFFSSLIGYVLQSWSTNIRRFRFRPNIHVALVFWVTFIRSIRGVIAGYD